MIMHVFLWLPLSIFGVVAFITCGVGRAVEIVERRRVAHVEATPGRRRFRPIVILGGRVDEAVPKPREPPGEAPEIETLAG